MAQRPMKKDEKCGHTNPSGTLMCVLKHGHSEPHKDVVGTRWNHPKVPYGMPYPKVKH